MVAGGALYQVPNADEIAAASDEGAVEAATIDGNLYAYPMTADNGYFLYYNKNYYYLLECKLQRLNQKV